MKQVVVVGGGFGGVYTVRHLLRSKDVRVVLINKSNFFVFTPMLHEVATGGLNRHNIVEPIRDVFNSENFRFVEAEVKSLDVESKKVVTDVGSFSYDFCVVAIGSTTNFFNVSGAKEFCFTLKDPSDAARLRNHCIEMVERASVVKKPELLTFVIVGGGPTGVEFAGELAEFVQQMHLKAGLTMPWKIVLVQRGDKIIPMAHERCIREAARELELKGVVLRLNSQVTKVQSDGVFIGDDFVKSSTIVWTSGVRPNQIRTSPSLVDDQGFLPVDEFLRVKGAKNVFALGDCAVIKSKPVPALAQAAVKQAKCVADNIIASIHHKSLSSFVFKQDGFLVSVGQFFAVAEIKNFRFKGFPAWWLWRTIYLLKMLGFAKKLRVAFDWTLNLFWDRDTSQIK